MALPGPSPGEPADRRGPGRSLRSRHPGAVPPDSASILDNLAVRLGGLGRLEEARAAHAESTEIWRALPEPLRRRYEGDLVLSNAVGSWPERPGGGDA
ncbi:tetratricopeptide repeat protein [Kitasatospora hibisci]|uniref:tetratricopeptide repeat protein n=1 Tax=Kitasatospora hibisci TaxID=3369522 RepID=UPI0037552F15